MASRNLPAVDGTSPSPSPHAATRQLWLATLAFFVTFAVWGSIAAFADIAQKATADEKVKGVILTSGKDSFIAGADLDMLLNTDTSDATAVMNQFSQLQRLFRSYETGGKPWVAAINGTALGGGLEICLACHYRIAINNPKTKFGQPEVKLGLLPGGGATQRIPRIMGMQASMPILLEGKELRPDAAKAAGLVHELVNTKEELLARAKAWCLANPKPIQPWDDPKFRFPGGDGKRRVSTGGGIGPLWRGDGKELFYHAADGKLMAAQVKIGASFEAGTPAPLFEFRASGNVITPYYDVTRDGQRFLLSTIVETEPNAPLSVVVNWAAELKK